MALLCTRDVVWVFLMIKDTDILKDELIDMLITPAQAFIEGYCKRSFPAGAVAESFIEYHHGGSDKVILNRFPIASTPAVKLYVDFLREFGEDQLIDSDYYYIDYDAGIIFVDYEFARTWGSVKVVYSTVAVAAGADAPRDVALAKQACIEIVARKVKTMAAGDFGVVSRGMPGGTSVTFSEAEILPETLMMLDLIC
jgi:hypothetical protein